MVAPYVDSCTTDVMGNLICHKKGAGPKVLFCAHMDSIGAIVTHVEKEGYLRFGKIGGLRPHSMLHTPVRFKNGVRGMIGLDEGVSTEKMTVDDLCIDIGAHDAEEAKAMVKIGDTAVYDSPTFAAGDRLISPYMDNRISCLVMLKAIEKLQHSSNDLYFVFTAQEELGLRGAKTVAYEVNPDYGIAIDVTISGDEMGTKHRGSSVLGGGAAIKVMDTSVICHPEMVKRLEDLAKERGIPHQMDIIKGGGTDAGAIHTTRSGVLTGGVSIPCRYVHSPVEMVDRGDVDACARLVAAFAETDF